MANSRWASLLVVAEVLSGYTVHAILSALGVAALVAASPFMFLVLKWFGVMYLAILPQFISPDDSAAIQVMILSMLFIFGCGLVYTLVGVLAATAYGREISGHLRRRIEAITGVILAQI